MPPALLRRRATAALLAALLAGVAAAPGALAQSAAETSQAAVYRYARPGQATIQIGVWGAVSQPGLYEVPPGTDLMDLLSLTGGPQISTENESQRQTITLRLARSSDSTVAASAPQSNRREVVFTSELEELTEIESEYPTLQGGDVLTIQRRVSNRFSWRDGLSIFQAAGTVVVLVLNILRF